MISIILLVITVTADPFPPQHGARDGFQIWREDANILNKESRTADNGRSSTWDVGCEDNNS
jgi:hypothetical protein